MRQTILEACSAEIDKQKGSRFIAYARPCTSVNLAELWTRELWSSHPDARHVCWAFRGDHIDRIRYVDDGEPTGTAGKPILTIIEGRGLEQIAVAVVRYFGGVKLGTGGLVRAYSSAAQAVLEDAELKVLRPLVDLEFTLDYHHERWLSHQLSAINAELKNQTFSEQVTIELTLLEEQVDSLINQLVEKTAGRALITRGSLYWG